MSGRSADRCEHAPLHEHHAAATTVADPDEEKGRVGELLKFAAQSTFAWFKDRPLDRLPILAGPLVFAGGLILNGYGVPWWAVGLPTVAAVPAAYAFGVNHTGTWGAIGLTAATAGTGAWLSTMAEIGANRPMIYIWMGAFSLGYSIFRWARSRAGGKKPQKVAANLERINWDMYLDQWGMGGATVIRATPHRLGERVRLNTKGTGKFASSFVGGSLRERIAQEFDLNVARVTVTNAGMPAGQIEISIQLRDPWAQVVRHPLFDMDAEIELPPVADVNKPLPIGMDPETGEALTTLLCDEDGGKHTYIIGTTGGGKSVVLNDLLERLTAAPNAVVWGINVSKAQEMRHWAPALDLTACGPGDRAKARKILKMACDAITWRGLQLRDAPSVIPSERQPLLVIIIDEISALTKKSNGEQDHGVIASLNTITSKGRSEGVVVIIAGQRGTQSQIGSTDTRTQITNYIVFKTATQTEIARVVGDGIEIPDMTTYGGKNKGVAATVNVDDDRAQMGRTFALGTTKGGGRGLAEIDEIVAERSPTCLEGALLAHLGEEYSALKNGQVVAETAPAAPQEARDTEDKAAKPLVTSSEERLATINQIKNGLFLVPKLTPEGKAKLIELRRAQQEQVTERETAAASPMNPHVRETLITLLRGRREGLANAEVRDTFKVSDRTALRYLQQLAAEGVAESRGQGPATRWFPVGNEHVA